MTLKPGKQTISVHILPNISRTKDNETMKFGQLIEYNTRNNSLEKVLYRLFLLYAKLRAI